MGYISDELGKQIKSSNEKVNQYDADLEACNQAMADAEKAKAIFDKASKQMGNLIVETGVVFQGFAEAAFVSKLATHNKAVIVMGVVMEKRIADLKKRIKEIEGQKFWCQVWTNILTGLMNTFKFFAL
ncbi:MAG: hypothetical protein K6E26_05790 [Clostridiales bacterium]|nr:hypothetical protein [Clostridiales bacterium]MCR5274855.1 hypothetical protein [Clostridiales bacterium]